MRDRLRVGIHALLLPLLVPVCGLAQQHSTELTPFVGYQFGGELEATRTKATIDPATLFGLTASFRVRHDGFVELLYSRQPARLDIDRGFERELLDLDVEVFHAGGLWEIRPEGRARPFLGMTVGASRLAPQDRSDEWLASLGLSGGYKVFLSERVGLRLEGRGLLSFWTSTGSIFCGAGPAGGGCALSVSGDPIVQVGFQLGLLLGF